MNCKPGESTQPTRKKIQNPRETYGGFGFRGVEQKRRRRNEGEAVQASMFDSNSEEARSLF